MWEERPAPWYSVPHTWEALKVLDCGWELKHMLTYSLPHPTLSEDRGASRWPASAVKASSLTPASLAHRCKRHGGISAPRPLRHSEIPSHMHARTPDLTILLHVNQQNMKHDRWQEGFLSATAHLQWKLGSAPEIPSKSHTYSDLCGISTSLAIFERLKSSTCPYRTVELHCALCPKAPLQQLQTEENLCHRMLIQGERMFMMHRGWSLSGD